MQKTTQDLEIAIHAVGEGASVAIAKGGRLLTTRIGHTVRPLIEALDEVGEESRGSSVADKVLGRAAALLLSASGAAVVHGIVMSAHGREVLEAAGVRHTYNRLVEYIINRTGDGMCPIEQISLGFDDPGEFIVAMREKLQMVPRG
ncbi:MAG: DUF1893 domain-containing protein [Bacillota bacterium]|nr:DUF1893 domain-containing protein [Bacillota bacterium]